MYLLFLLFHNLLLLFNKDFLTLMILKLASFIRLAAPLAIQSHLGAHIVVLFCFLLGIEKWLVIAIEWAANLNPLTSIHVMIHKLLIRNHLALQAAVIAIAPNHGRI